MKKSRFTDRQIMSVLKQLEAGVTVAELSRAERVNLKWTVCFKLIVNFLELPEALGS